MKLVLLVAAVTGLAAAADTPNVQELLEQSVANTERNWKEAPNYAFTEHDVEEKLDYRGGIKTKTDKTYEVVMMDGSPYHRLTAVNDKPLSPPAAEGESQKLAAERRRRQQETQSERSKRIAKYQRERRQDQALLREMADAFVYKPDGEQTINGRLCYVLNATPKPGYVPKTRETKVLTGMKGTLWIDKADVQWVKVEAEVIHPVTFYAIATVSPGTRFEFEQEPVGGRVWMARHFSVRVNSSILWMSRNSNEDESYSNYHRVSGEAARDTAPSNR